MADPITPAEKPAKSQADLNAEIAAAQAAQDASGHPNSGDGLDDTSGALDALVAAKAPVVDPAEPAAGTPPADPAVPAAAAPAAGDPPAEPVVDPAIEAAKKRAEDLFKGSPSLPANASPKSSEAFSQVKIKAAQEVAKLEAEIATLKEQVKTTGQPTPEQLAKEQELEDHRQWRAKLDVDADPKFKVYEQNIAKASEFIYDQLSKNPGVTPDMIEKIKKLGGPHKVNLDKLFDSLKDPTLQRLVESKVNDIHQSEFEKGQAIKATKDNIKGYLSDRQKAAQAAAGAHTSATKEHLTQYLPALEWFKERTPDAKADDATKKGIEAHNKFVGDLRTQVDLATQDDSPQMRAVLITGLAQLMNLQREHAALVAKNTATEKERDEYKTKWEGVKKASSSRLPNTAAPSGGIQQKTTAPDVHQRAGDALDALAKQVMEKRAAAGN